jgi:hypothetical protein
MKKIILSAVILLMSITIVKSQVTIGLNQEPGKAALLDLKTKVADANNVTVDFNKPGGLVLPRVQLISANTLEPFISTGSSEWTDGTNQTNNKKWHTGMMVYNLKNGDGFLPGIYFWDGSAWVAAKSTASAVTANNGLTKTGDNIQLGGTLTGNTTINPNNYDLDFTGALKIDNPNSKIFMDGTRTNIPDDDDLDNIITLGINGATGEVVTMRASESASTKAINYIEYQIVAQGDWIKNFDTKISVAKYTLVIAGFRFVPFSDKIGIRVGNRLRPLNDPYGSNWPTYPGVAGNPITSTHPKSPIVNVYADKYYRNSAGAIEGNAKNHWRIHADYAEAEPDDRVNGKWIINCLVLNNSLVKFYDTPIQVNSNTFGSNTGNEDVEAGSSPPGLPD